MSNSKTLGKRLLAVILTVIMLMSMVTIGITATSAANVEIAETAATAETMRLYFQNNWLWTDVKVYFWGSSTATNPSWSGYSMNLYENDGTYDVYYYDVPTDVTGVIFNGIKNDGSGNRDQTPNIESGWEDGLCYYMVWNNGNAVGTHTDYIVEETTVAETTVAETTVAETTVAETTVAETTVAETTVAETTVAETTVAETTVAETTVAETTVAETTVAETTVAETTVAETTVAETTVAETTAAETTVVETTVAETTVVETTPVEVTIDLPWSTESGLYAYAGTTVEDSTKTNAWQRWHENGGKRYFLLAPTASDTEVIIYSTYTSDVTVNGVTIKPGEFETVPYVDGTTYTCSGATTQSVKISKTDAEGAIYVNSKDGMVTVNDDSAETETEQNAQYDLYAFLTGGTKNREGSGVAGAVASAENGVNDDATIKKIKGRGNSTWSETKKPFNITYKDNIQLDGMKGKKWSLLANAKDGSLLRNRLVYDMANEVEMTYACDSRFVDFFVNGYYKGSYQLTQKIEMGKNTVMPDLEEPEVEDIIDEDTGETIEYPKTDFDFILELDTELNAASANDKGFNTTAGQWMTFKTPDDPATEQIAFIKAKYQAVEDALYGDDMATLAELIDIEDFAKAYLINEVSKNIDSGVTSCYFTYNSADGKFYASPVWDYDNSLGNLPDNSARTDMSGNTLDLDGPSGWYARELKHYARNARSIFSEAWYNTSETADGKTFSDIVLDVWNAEFAGLVDKLEGTTASTGRLNTIDSYMANLAKSGSFNTKADGAYVTADWKASKTSLTMYDYDAEKNTLSQTTKSYTASFEGEADYAGDWLISRLNWMAAQYASAEVDVPDDYITVYFQNNWLWTDVRAHVWGSSAEGFTATTWPGNSMTFVANDGTYDVYSVTIPADASVIFNGKHNENGSSQQTPNIEDPVDGRCYYMVWNNENDVEYVTIQEVLPEIFATTAPVTTTTPATDPTETTTTPVETTTAPVDETSSVVATDPTETTTTPVETTTTPVEETSSVVATDPTETTTVPVTTTPEKDTITVYFQNNWLWTDVRAHVWGSSAEGFTATTWPGNSMTFVANDGTYDVYSVTIPADASVIFNGKHNENGSSQQTPNIEDPVDGRCYYMVWNNENDVEYVTIQEVLPEIFNTTPVETTTPVEETTSTPVEETTTTPVVETTTAPVEETTTTPVVETSSTAPVEETSSTVVENTTSTPAIEDEVYVVTWADSDKYTVETDLDATAVKAGTDFTFTVTAAEGYKVAAVIVDMALIEAVDGVYTINVTKDTTILVITAEDTTVPEVMKFMVSFVDKDGFVLSEQEVEYGKAAVAPAAPEVDGYTFDGWSEPYDYITKDVTIQAQYKKIVIPPTPATTGTLKIELSGGSSFTIAINGGVARPQGSTFTSTSVPIGATVTVVANATGDKEFIGWVNPATGFVATTDYEFTFTTSGNDFYKAVFNTKVDGVNMVSFYNDVTKQYLDVQYYAATDEIVWPTVDPVQAGYDFVGWNMTAEEIAAELAAGKDVTVLPEWEKQLVYVTLDVVGGNVTAGEEKDGKYLANTKTTVKANAAADGYKFAYWTLDGKVVTYNEEYSFYPKADAKLEAVFVTEDTTVEYKVLAEVSSFTATQYGQFGISWYVPEAQNNLTYKGAGIVAVKENLYNESTFVHGTTDANVWDRSLNTDKANGSAVWTGPVLSGETWIAACWVQYTDNATGETVVIYSDLFTVTKE